MNKKAIEGLLEKIKKHEKKMSKNLLEIFLLPDSSGEVKVEAERLRTNGSHSYQLADQALALLAEPCKCEHDMRGWKSVGYKFCPFCGRTIKETNNE